MNHGSSTGIAELISRSAAFKGNRPCVAGTGVTVKRIAAWHKLGMDPEAIAAQFGHLSLAQVHAALAYYYANREEIDSDIEQEASDYDRLAALAALRAIGPVALPDPFLGHQSGPFSFYEK